MALPELEPAPAVKVQVGAGSAQRRAPLWGAGPGPLAVALAAALLLEALGAATAGPAAKNPQRAYSPVAPNLALAGGRNRCS